MTAFEPIVDIENEARVVYDLIIAAKKASKARKIEIIKMHLSEGDTASYKFRQELMHFLFSPLRTFNLKPKKGWPTGSLDGHRTWTDAHQLLLKLESRGITGNAARDAAEALCATLKPWCADLFKRCLEKRPDAGMTASTLNKAIPGYVPEFKCALAEPFDPKRAKWPMIVQPKLDGVRVLAHVEVKKERVTYFSRKGLTFSSMDHLTSDCVALARSLQQVTGAGCDMVLDGEVFGDNFKESISAVRKKDAAALNTDFHVYDFMLAKHFFAVTSSHSQKDRSKSVVNAFKRLFESGSTQEGLRVKMLPSMVVNDHETAVERFRLLQDLGFEGAVLKDPQAVYSFRRSYAWMKMKSQESADLTIIGYEEGTGKYEGQLGALVVDYNGVEVRVGSGLTDALRSSLWGCMDDVVGRIIEVEYMEETPDGSLRHPRFVCFRDLPDSPGVKV